MRFRLAVRLRRRCGLTLALRHVFSRRPAQTYPLAQYAVVYECSSKAMVAWWLLLAVPKAVLVAAG